MKDWWRIGVLTCLVVIAGQMGANRFDKADDPAVQYGSDQDSTWERSEKMAACANNQLVWYHDDGFSGSCVTPEMYACMRDAGSEYWFIIEQDGTCTRGEHN